MTDAVWSGVDCTRRSEIAGAVQQRQRLGAARWAMPHGAELLADTDTLVRLSGHRRPQGWDAFALGVAPLLLGDAPVKEGVLELPAALEGEDVLFDDAAWLPTAASLHDVPGS